jgi:hypothetical protein
MSLPSMALLTSVLSGTRPMPELGAAEWDLLIRQARNADLLARLGGLARNRGDWAALPSAPRQHLESALKLCERQHTELRHEVGHIGKALAPLGLPVVLLKGAAYVAANLDAASGRMVSDVDILVPRERLADVESALMMAGWVSTNQDAYDQRYYREWMHEIPPLQHMSRGAILDVHHAILPLTARFKPDTAALMASAVPVNDSSMLRVLCPADMVLHSAAHLFHEGELEMGMRGIVDLDALLRGFSLDAAFWERLLERAARLDLNWPLYQALHYSHHMLGTPVPDGVLRQVAQRLPQRLFAWRQGLLDALYLRALRPAHLSLNDPWTPLARFLIYLRGHWLRMPPHLLLRHLLRKFLFSHRSESTQP